MRKAKISGVVAGALIALSLGTAPAFAAGDTDITVGSNGCELGTAGLGAGTAADPFRIGTAKQLAEVNDCYGDGYKYFVQTADIDLTMSDSTDWNKASNGGWTPIGTNSDRFTGSYNGRNHSITNFTIDRDSSNQGLFGVTSEANIKNLNLSGSINIPNDEDYVGPLAGDLEYSNLSNITTDVDITSFGNYVGGIVGYANESNLKNVVVEGTLTGTDYDGYQSEFGGITGYGYYANVFNATVNGDVLLQNADPLDASHVVEGSYVGGIGGEFYYGQITDSIVNGDVTGTEYVGGVVGYGYCGLIENVVMNGNIDISNEVTHSSITYVGGITGYWEEQAIKNATMNGAITIHANDTDSNSSNQYVNYVGGISGYLDYVGIIDSSVTGNITVEGEGEDNNEDIGGIFGYGDYVGVTGTTNSGDITVENADYVGGIAGYGYYGMSFNRTSNEGDITVTNPLNSNTANIGGLTGFAGYGFLISKSSNSGDVTATGSNTDHVGGLVGESNTALAIHDSYNRGNISANNYAGGILGYSHTADLEIANSYSTGTTVLANGNSDADPLVAYGWEDVAADATSTFDSQTASASTSISGVTGRTTAEMKTASTFEDLGWSIGDDTHVWSIDSSKNDGYPYLNGVAAEASDNSGGGSQSAGDIRDLLGPIKFKKGSAKLTKAAKLKLASYASAIKTEGYDKVTVKSYTKSTNTKLSVKRNKAIVKYLKGKGVTTKLYKEAVTRSSKKKNNTAIIVAVKKATT